MAPTRDCGPITLRHEPVTEPTAGVLNRLSACHDKQAGIRDDVRVDPATGIGTTVMKMVVTAALLTAALLLAVLSAVQAQTPRQHQSESVTPTVLLGE